VNGILYSEAWVNQDATWQSNLPFVVEGLFTIGENATLAIAPGSVVKVRHPGPPTNEIGIKILGNLHAIGTAESPIVFTRFDDDEYGGDTNNDGPSPHLSGGNFVLFVQGSSIFQNGIVRYGGRRWGVAGVPPLGAITVGNSATLSFQNSVVEQSAHAGIMVLASAGTVEINESIIRNHERMYCNSDPCFSGGTTVGMDIESGATPMIQNSVFENNAYHIYWPGSHGLCESLHTTNSFDASGEMICEGAFPSP
jgi:hypothetical protein